MAPELAPVALPGLPPTTGAPMAHSRQSAEPFPPNLPSTANVLLREYRLQCSVPRDGTD